jgi:hypothetical protein
VVVSADTTTRFEGELVEDCGQFNRLDCLAGLSVIVSITVIALLQINPGLSALPTQCSS